METFEEYGLGDLLFWVLIYSFSHSIDVGEVVIFFFGSRLGALGDDRDPGGGWTLIYS